MLKRLAKIIGLLGGIGALVWAMRDRFVSLAVSREPEPPAFRTRSSEGLTPVDAIDGIGPVFAQRLNAAGMGSVEEMIGHRVAEVAAAAGVSESRAQGWLEKANQTST